MYRYRAIKTTVLISQGVNLSFIYLRKSGNEDALDEDKPTFYCVLFLDSERKALGKYVAWYSVRWDPWNDTAVKLNTLIIITQIKLEFIKKNDDVDVQHDHGQNGDVITKRDDVEINVDGVNIKLDDVDVKVDGGDVIHGGIDAKMMRYIKRR